MQQSRVNVHAQNYAFCCSIAANHMTAYIQWIFITGRLVAALRRIDLKLAESKWSAKLSPGDREKVEYRFKKSLYGAKFC